MSSATYQTKVPSTLVPYCEAMGFLLGQAERQREHVNESRLGPWKETQLCFVCWVSLSLYPTYMSTLHAFPDMLPRKLTCVTQNLAQLKTQNPALIFGEKKLWRAQFNLEANSKLPIAKSSKSSYPYQGQLGYRDGLGLPTKRAKKPISN